MRTKEPSPLARAAIAPWYLFSRDCRVLLIEPKAIEPAGMGKHFDSDRMTHAAKGKNAEHAVGLREAIFKYAGHRIHGWRYGSAGISHIETLTRDEMYENDITYHVLASRRTQYVASIGESSERFVLAASGLRTSWPGVVETSACSINYTLPVASSRASPAARRWSSSLSVTSLILSFHASRLIEALYRLNGFSSAGI